MNTRRGIDGSYPELFPVHFGERLEKFVDLPGLSWEDLAECTGVEHDRVMEWYEGAVPTGGEVWRIMLLALSVPSGNTQSSYDIRDYQPSCPALRTGPLKSNLSLSVPYTTQDFICMKN